MSLVMQKPLFKYWLETGRQRRHIRIAWTSSDRIARTSVGELKVRLHGYMDLSWSDDVPPDEIDVQALACLIDDGEGALGDFDETAEYMGSESLADMLEANYRAYVGQEAA